MRSIRSQPVAAAILLLLAVVVVGLVVQASRGGSTQGARTSTSDVTVTTTDGSTTTATGGTTDPASGLPWIDEAALPSQARATLALIRTGGPFPYPRSDNQTFSNREGRLPRESRSYYKEFTVITPGSSDRGARRIITGAKGEKYWTKDHYASFSRIRERS
ncbi:MAG: guanine-specific ribonuclease [Humibacillus sp.]|nr:guanine-specific ribonuclease [Humibacillus sp.]